MAAAQEAAPGPGEDDAGQAAGEGAETGEDARDWPGDPLVAKIQTGLKELGYDLSVVDGLMGPNTRSAIEAFQTDAGLPPTGDPSIELRRAIARAKFQRSQAAATLWHRTRRYLRALGYAPGSGSFESAAARQALKAFIDDHALERPPTFDAGLARRVADVAEREPKAQERLCRSFMDTHVYAKALVWCRRAGRHGVRDAQYFVGWMHYYGRGTAVDYGGAFRWYRKAALNGDPRAMTFVGLMYRKGRGVDRDPERALSWYERAVEAGKAEAGGAAPR